MAIRIHAGLAVSRPHFIAKCLKAARTHSEAPAQTQSLDQASELAVVVCQLLFGRLLIAMEEYFTSSQEGQEFVEVTFEEACRHGSPAQRDDLIRRYFKDDDEGVRKFIFGSDLARHITGKDAPKYAMALAGAPTDFLRLTSWFVVSRAFGDGSTTAKAKKELDAL